MPNEEKKTAEELRRARVLAIADAAGDRRESVHWQEKPYGDVLILSAAGAEVAVFEDLSLVVSASGHTAEEFRVAAAAAVRLLGYVEPVRVEPAKVEAPCGGLFPGQCCERDHDRDGNCDRHPAHSAVERVAVAHISSVSLLTAVEDALTLLECSTWADHLATRALRAAYAREVTR